MSSKPIGIFDSGVGGTSIWKEIHLLLPNENTIYIADSKNAPYGPKGKERIVELSKKNTELLLKKECKLIVVACNTATTNAIDFLRANYSIPFIGIEPAIKPAALQTKTGTIGILATKGTLTSTLFHKTSNLFTDNIEIMEQEGEGIVQLIEKGQLHSEAMKSLLKVYLQPMLKANIDHLVLGCTHYPYLMPLLIDMLPKHVKIIDSGHAVAKQTKTILDYNGLINESSHKIKTDFFSNGDTGVIQSLLPSSCKVTYLDF